MVFSISQATHKCSLVFNRLLLYYLNNNIELPKLDDQTLFNQCLKIGEAKMKKDNPHLRYVWEKYFKDYPRIPPISGDAQVYSYAAITYKTNFKNSLIYAFYGRQKRFIKCFLKQQNLNEKLVSSVMSKINGFQCKTEPPQELIEFINWNRDILQNNGSITHTWLGTHMQKVVIYYYQILKYLETFPDQRLFTLAPISKIKSHYMTIDKVVLRKLLMNSGKIKKISPEKFNEKLSEHWNSSFNTEIKKPEIKKPEIKKPETKNSEANKSETKNSEANNFEANKSETKNSGKVFTGTIQTDGISLCIHFRCPKKIIPAGNRQIKKGDNRVIAIDPGKTNLIYGVEDLRNNNYKKYVLTRKTYYNQSGMTKANKKAKTWEKQIEQEEKTYAEISLKTTNEDKWEKFIENYISVYDTLWEQKTKTKWGQQRFRTYRLKQKCLDKFFASMRGPKRSENPVIAYGAAKFNPNSKSELSAPTTSLSRKCSNFYPTVMVDEFRTTKICYKCDCQLHPVSKKAPGYKYETIKGVNIDMKVKKNVIIDREIRGLRWCSSTKCRKFYNRDLNAALNILRCYKSGTIRPGILSRNCNEALGSSTFLRIF